MQVIVAAVGRLKKGPERELVDGYLGALPWRVREREVEARRARTPAEVRREEGERLLATLPREAAVVALDAGGTALSSEAFAERLREWRDTGDDTAFVIGGADGLDAAVRDRADLRLAFGVQTWPHRLARVMLAEQLYRAAAILNGHPYHR